MHIGSVKLQHQDSEASNNRMQRTELHAAANAWRQPTGTCPISRP